MAIFCPCASLLQGIRRRRRQGRRGCLSLGTVMAIFCACASLLRTQQTRYYSFVQCRRRQEGEKHKENNEEENTDRRRRRKRKDWKMKKNPAISRTGQNPATSSHAQNRRAFSFFRILISSFDKLYSAKLHPHFSGWTDGEDAEDLTTKLMPRKFAREFGNELSDIVQLKDPTSKIWRVTLEKLDGEIYFKSGWKKFVDYHSLDYGYMLVFNYVGNSRFTVQVFDTSTCEKEYPSLEESPENNASEEESDDSVENLGVHYAADGNQQTKEHDNNLLKNGKTKQPSSSLEDMEHSQERKTTRTVKLMARCRYMSRRDLTPRKTHEALLKAENFQSDKPFFEAVIRPSYASFCTGLPIPTRFVKDHFKRRPEFVKLCLDGDEWEVECKYWKKGTFLFKGWSKFASTNNIKVGDVCIFELINKNMQFRVIIYHC